MLATPRSVELRLRVIAEEDTARLILVTEPSKELATLLGLGEPRADNVAEPRSGPPAYLYHREGDEALGRNSVADSGEEASTVSAVFDISGPSASLTDREKEVLRQVAVGRPSKRIARALNISERTVKAQLTSIFGKLGVDNRAQAAVLAVRNDLL